MNNKLFANISYNKIILRPINEADQQFLYKVYAESRADEMKLVDWDDAQKLSFLKMQFNAQHQYYMEQFKGAEFAVLEYDQKALGRLYVDRRDKDIRIIDISLLIEYRNLGFGSYLLKSLINEAMLNKQSVSIHVEKNNPALSLYKKLGFINVEDQGVYYLMKWNGN